MKKFIFTIILSVFMISCTFFSKKGKEVNYAKKNLESGNYYEAIINYSNALIIDYDYKPAIKGLNSIYKIGIDAQLNKINYLKETNSEDYPYEVEKMYLIYKNIARLRNESFSLLDFKLDFEELKFWQLESSKEFYNSAKLIKNPKTTFDFKKISKLYKKSYKAIVEGEIKEKLEINKPITNDTGLIKLKMKTDSNGKESTTIIKPIFYDQKNNQTLVEAIPLTGRQHQIRVHLDSIGHKIVGDPLYGVDENFADKFLKNKISKEDRINVTKATRLMLQADFLEFEFLDVIYKFSSKQKL